MKISAEDVEILCQVARNLNSIDDYDSEVDIFDCWEMLNDVIDRIEEE